MLPSIRTQENPPLKWFSVGCSSLFMRLALHLTTTLRAWCKATSAWSVKKPDVLRPGVVGMRGSTVVRLRPCMIMSNPLRPFSCIGTCHPHVRAETASQTVLNRMQFTLYDTSRWRFVLGANDTSLLLRGTIVNRTCGAHKNQYNHLLLMTIFGSIYS